MKNESKQKSFPEERRQQIRALIEENGRVSVDELTLRFHVSKVTIRGDLDFLEADGIIRRTHGGALILSTDAGTADPPFAERRQFFAAEKLRIAQAAAAMIDEGDIVFLDAGTTSLQIAKCLKRYSNLTVVTIGLSIAMELAGAAGVTVVVTGGILRGAPMSLVGDYATRVLETIHIRKAFLGCKGLTLAEGLTDVNAFEVATKKFVASRCDQVIAVTDHSKWGRVAFATFANIDQLTKVISDTLAPIEIVTQLRTRGVSVELV